MTTINCNLKKKKEKVAEWNSALSEFNSVDLKNNTGRSRTYEENILILLTTKLILKMKLDDVSDNIRSIDDINWTTIEEIVAEGLHVRREHVTSLRKSLLSDDTVLSFNTTTRGMGSPNAELSTKLSYNQLVAMVDEVDECHADGRTVNASFMANFIRDEFNIEVTHRTVHRYFHKMGLTWQPIRSKKKNIGMYRMDSLRDFLIELDKYYKEWIKGPEESEKIFVFADESYVHQGHSYDKSYLKKNSVVNKKSSKGQRLIMLHAISPFGPLVERINNKPIDDLVWKQDTPHPTQRIDGLLTCELLWKASSSSGDYHDNMNSDMFMKWITGKLVPTFEKLYKDKKMILICDNASYHHKREIGSLACKTKFQMIELCKEHNIEYIDIPITENRRIEMSIPGLIFETMVPINDVDCRVAFDEYNFNERAGRNHPFVPNSEELKVGIIKYLKENKPHLLECKVEKYLYERGHEILWTPPYSPDLQPIELFWAAGKNHARNFSSNRSTMKETVMNVREGWYGNIHDWEANDAHLLSDYRRQRKEPADCHRLFQHAIKMANTKFVPMCEGITGTIGNLTVDADHLLNREGIPIDMLVNLVSKIVSDDENDVDDDEDDFE